MCNRNSADIALVSEWLHSYEDLEETSNASGTTVVGVSTCRALLPKVSSATFTEHLKKLKRLPV